MINVGVIGVGYWGPNIIRNMIANKRLNVTVCSDLKQNRLDHISSFYPSLKTTQNYKDIINDPSVG